MRLDEVRVILEASLLAGEEPLATEVRFGCASDLMSDVLAFSLPDALLLTGLTTIQAIYTAEMAALKAVVFVLAWIGQFIGHRIEGKKPSFLQDIVFLLIGPAWLMSFVYRKIGQKY